MTFFGEVFCWETDRIMSQKNNAADFLYASYSFDCYIIPDTFHSFKPLVDVVSDVSENAVRYSPPEHLTRNSVCSSVFSSVKGLGGIYDKTVISSLPLQSKTALFAQFSNIPMQSNLSKIMQFRAKESNNGNRDTKISSQLEAAGAKRIQKFSKNSGKSKRRSSNILIPRNNPCIVSDKTATFVPFRITMCKHAVEPSARILAHTHDRDDFSAANDFCSQRLGTPNDYPRKNTILNIGCSVVPTGSLLQKYQINADKMVEMTNSFDDFLDQKTISLLQSHAGNVPLVNAMHPTNAVSVCEQFPSRNNLLLYKPYAFPSTVAFPGVSDKKFFSSSSEILEHTVPINSHVCAQNLFVVHDPQNCTSFSSKTRNMYFKSSITAANSDDSSMSAIAASSKNNSCIVYPTAPKSIWTSKRIISNVCSCFTIPQLLRLRQINKSFMVCADYALRRVLYTELHRILTNTNSSGFAEPTRRSLFSFSGCQAGLLSKCPLHVEVLCKLLKVDAAEREQIKKWKLPFRKPLDFETPRYVPRRIVGASKKKFNLSEEADKLLFSNAPCLNLLSHETKEVLIPSISRVQTPLRDINYSNTRAVGMNSHCSVYSNRTRPFLTKFYQCFEREKCYSGKDSDSFVRNFVSSPLKRLPDTCASSDTQTNPARSSSSSSVNNCDDSRAKKLVDKFVGGDSRSTPSSKNLDIIRIRQAFLKLWNYSQIRLKTQLVKQMFDSSCSYAYDTALIILRTVYQLSFNTTSIPPVNCIIQYLTSRTISDMWNRMAELSGFHVCEAQQNKQRNKFVELLGIKTGKSCALLWLDKIDFKKNKSIVSPSVFNAIENRLAKLPTQFIFEFSVAGRSAFSHHMEFDDIDFDINKEDGETGVSKIIFHNKVGVPRETMFLQQDKSHHLAVNDESSMFKRTMDNAGTNKMGWNKYSLAKFQDKEKRTIYAKSVCYTTPSNLRGNNYDTICGGDLSVLEDIYEWICSVMTYQHKMITSSAIKHKTFGFCARSCAEMPNSYQKNYLRPTHSSSCAAIKTKTPVPNRVKFSISCSDNPKICTALKKTRNRSSVSSSRPIFFCNTGKNGMLQACRRGRSTFQEHSSIYTSPILHETCVSSSSKSKLTPALSRKGREAEMLYSILVRQENLLKDVRNIVQKLMQR